MVAQLRARIAASARKPPRVKPALAARRRGRNGVDRGTVPTHEIARHAGGRPPHVVSRLRFGTAFPGHTARVSGRASGSTQQGRSRPRSGADARPYPGVPVVSRPGLQLRRPDDARQLTSAKLTSAKLTPACFPPETGARLGGFPGARPQNMGALRALKSLWTGTSREISKETRHCFRRSRSAATGASISNRSIAGACSRTPSIPRSDALVQVGTGCKAPARLRSGLCAVKCEMQSAMGATSLRRAPRLRGAAGSASRRGCDCWRQVQSAEGHEAKIPAQSRRRAPCA